MKFNKTYKNTLVASSVVISTALFTSCSNDDNPLAAAGTSDPIAPAETSSVRVIHASADAPPVNIKLNNAVAVPDLDYPMSTGFVSIPAGTYDVAVDAIVPGGNLEGVITVPGFSFAKDQRYTVVAIDDTASIDEFVAEESAATPAADEVAISVLHAATAVKGIDVDVYVTAPGVDLNSVQANFTFDFKGQVDAGALPAGEYQIRVVANGDATKTAVYDSGSVDLSGFGGQKLLLLAVNTVNSTTKTASPVKLVAYTDTKAQVELLDTRTTVGARVVHLSPDAGTVEVFASSSALGNASPVELIPAFSYIDTVPGVNSYVPVPAGDYIFDVAADNTGIGSSVYTSSSLKLDTAIEYTVIAAGYVSAGTPAFDLLPTADSNRSIVTQASVKVVHGAPLAGIVNVYVTPAGVYTKEQVEGGMAGEPLLNDFAFGTITDYVPVPAGDYDIRVVTNAGAGTAAINVKGFNLAAGSVSTVIARQPVSGGGTPSDFNLIVLSNQ